MGFTQACIGGSNLFSFTALNHGSNLIPFTSPRGSNKQSLHPGSLNLTLGSGSKAIQLTDDSNTTSLTRFIGENRVFYIISGSSGNAYTSSAATGPYYGMMLPDIGVIILDASGSLTPYIQAASLLTSSAQNNYLNLYNSITSGSLTQGFQLQSEEVISSRYFFTRVKNSEFNYTTNPSAYRDWETDRKSTRLNSSHEIPSRMPSSA